MPITTRRLITFSRNIPVAAANSRKLSKPSNVKKSSDHAAPSKIGTTTTGTITSHET